MSSSDYGFKPAEFVPVQQDIGVSEAEQKQHETEKVSDTYQKAQTALIQVADDFSRAPAMQISDSQKALCKDWQKHFKSEKSQIKKDLNEHMSSYKTLNNRLSKKMNTLQKKISEKMEKLESNKRELGRLEAHVEKAGTPGPFSYTSRRITQLKTDIARREGKIEKYSSEISEARTELVQAKKDTQIAMQLLSNKANNIWNTFEKQSTFRDQLIHRSGVMKTNIESARKAGISPTIIREMQEHRYALHQMLDIAREPMKELLDGNQALAATTLKALDSKIIKFDAERIAFQNLCLASCEIRNDIIAARKAGVSQKLIDKLEQLRGKIDLVVHRGIVSTGNTNQYLAYIGRQSANILQEMDDEIRDKGRRPEGQSPFIVRLQTATQNSFPGAIG